MARIFVLEDDDTFGRTVIGLLRSLEHDAHLFATPAPFLQAVEEEAPNLVIIDQWLGAKNGLQIVDELALDRPSLPVILISGGGGNLALDTVTAIADVKGVDGVLLKPFGKESLANAIRAVLDRAGRQQPG